MAWLLVSCVYVMATLLSPGAAADWVSTVQTLSWDNFTLVQHGEWMIEFYAPWCPACKQFEGEWEGLAYQMSDTGVKVVKVDVSSEAMLSGRFMVTHLPTVYHIKDGQVRFYEGERVVSELVSYVMERKWMNSDPISYWWSPTAPHMYLVGTMFWMSEKAKDWQNVLESQYNMPTYAIFMILALATIMVGLLLGTITVCMIEVCFRVCSRGTKKSLRSVKPQGEQPPQDQTPIESVKEGYAGGEEMEGKDGARQRIKGDL